MIRAVRAYRALTIALASTIAAMFIGRWIIETKFPALDDRITGDFMPHGMCYLWNSKVILVHNVANLIIALSYFLMPACLFYVVWKRKDLKAGTTLFLGGYGLFILACGATHVMSIIVVKHPWYWAEGYLLAMTALISAPVAFFTVLVVPRLLGLGDPFHLIDHVAKIEKTGKRIDAIEYRLENGETAAEKMRLRKDLKEACSELATLHEELDLFLKEARKVNGGKTDASGK